MQLRNSPKKCFSCLCFAIATSCCASSFIPVANAQESSVLSGGVESNSGSMFSNQDDKTGRRNGNSRTQRRAYQRSYTEPELPDWEDRGPTTSAGVLPPTNGSDPFASDEEMDIEPIPDFPDTDYESGDDTWGIDSSSNGNGTNTGTGTNSGTGSNSNSGTDSSSQSGSTQDQVLQNSSSSGGSGSTFIVELRLF